MSFFIFIKNFDNVEAGSIYRIAENQNDLNNLNINLLDYKIIEDTQENFNLVKCRKKSIDKYVNNNIFYSDLSISYLNKENLKKEIDFSCEAINFFLESNKNHLQYDQWNNYKNQLKILNLNTITYPLNKSLEQYFNDLGQPSYNILQLP